MARLGKDLPTEILEDVLSRLPVHVLCRFRLVCKRWNQLISRPGFASLCAQSPGQASYVLFTPNELKVETETEEERRNWEVLDVAENRFFRMKDSFIADYLSRSEEFKCGWRKYTLAADGGLIYAVYASLCDDFKRHIVCNPVSKDFHQIAELSPFCGRSIVAMSVDAATKSYRIATTESYEQRRTRSRSRDRRGRFFLYDSTSTGWKILCEFPGDKYRGCSSIFMQGMLYTLFLDPSVAPCCLHLHSCDTETGVLSSTDVEFPRPTRSGTLKLVVSLGRLFYVEYRRRPHTLLGASEALDADAIVRRINPCESQGSKIQQRIKVRIWEVLPAEKELIKVVKKSFAMEIPRMTFVERPEIVVSDVDVFGCADSIIISSLSHRVRFDLLKQSWHELPENTWHMHDVCPKDKNRAGICSGLLHLDLREMRH